MLFRRLDQLNRPSRSSCRPSWRSSLFAPLDVSIMVVTPVLPLLVALLLFCCVCVCDPLGSASPMNLLAFAFAVCERQSIGDALAPLKKTRNGEARAGGRCVNSTQLCRLVRHNYHAEQIDGQYRISVSVDNPSTSMIGLLCR